jgi:competence protein ComEA
MAATPQERLALGVAALLLAAGVAARALGAGPPDAALSGDPAGASSIQTLVAETSKEADRAALRRKPLAAGERIDPNTASVDELDRLDGVGEATAKAIVERRQSHGAFRTLADLDSVTGIGPATLRKIAAQVTLPAGPATAPGTASRTAGPASSFQPAASVADSPPSSASVALVDLNTATAAQLEALPGIGSTLAGRIVAYRESHGRFRSVDDLKQIQNMRAATIEQLRGRVTATP